MNLLLLGGTVFVGRHLVEAARARGHRVTLFNRGQHNPELFPEVERLRGERDGGLDALRGRTWDAVIDTCGYVPRVVRDSARLLRDSVGHYTFISSLSALGDMKTPGQDESGPVATMEDATVEEVTGETYGPLKALCEAAVEEEMPGRALVVRPGLIVGPYDPTDRFTYWPRRVAHGGEVLAPGRPDALVQFIDARDLAAWTLDMVERRAAGVYNATGVGRPYTMGELFDTCFQVSASGAQLTWVDEAFLAERRVQGWSDMPLWIPEAEGMGGFSTVDCCKAIAAGLRFRPVADTVRDTLAWDRTLPADRPLRAGITREREAELLAEYAARSGERGVG